MREKSPSASDFWASLVVIGAGLSVTRFLRAPLVMLESKRALTLSASLFWANLVVIGAGLSVTRFLSSPLVTLESKRAETLSASDLLISASSWTSPWVIGESESLTRLTKASLVMFSPLSFPTRVAGHGALPFHPGVWSSMVLSASSYGKPLSRVSARVFPPLYGSRSGLAAFSSGTLWIIMETVTL